MAYCNEEGCQVLTTGKCVNDLVLNECPHYKETIENKNFGELEPDEEPREELTDISRHTGGLIDIYSGKALELGDVNRISGAAISRLIILAGMPDAGKTTLLLSLMHLFQTEPEFEDYIFAGSETLLDFEEKAHPSKAESENLEEKTVRTPIGSPTFLHLAVFSNTTGETINLLFTDISGELFRSLKDNTEECKKFTLAKRADHFAILFDAERITTFKDRASTKTSGIGIIKSLIQAGTLKPHTRIQIIFSRWDLYLQKGQDPEHDQYIDLLKKDLQTQFGDSFELDFVEVSARPKNGPLKFGYGIEKIFPKWVNQSILDKQIPTTEYLKSPNSRQYLQYELKD
jgi:Double-GTPase 2